MMSEVSTQLLFRECFHQLFLCSYFRYTCPPPVSFCTPPALTSITPHLTLPPHSCLSFSLFNGLHKLETRENSVSIQKTWLFCTDNWKRNFESLAQTVSAKQCGSTEITSMCSFTLLQDKVFLFRKSTLSPYCRFSFTVNAEQQKSGSQTYSFPRIFIFHVYAQNTSPTHKAIYVLYICLTLRQQTACLPWPLHLYKGK